MASVTEHVRKIISEQQRRAKDRPGILKIKIAKDYDLLVFVHTCTSGSMPSSSPLPPGVGGVRLIIIPAIRRGSVRKGSFSKVQVYKRVGVSQAVVHERVGKSEM